MSLHNNTVPQVLYNTPDPHSQPSELYKINGTVLATATDPVKCWVIHEEHGRVAQPLRLPFRVADPLKFKGPDLEFPRIGGWARLWD